MANTRSAEKQHRQAVKRRAMNKAAVSRLRSQIKRARAVINGEEGDLSAVMSETFSVIDRAAKRNLIKDNTASRYKSRLARSARRNENAQAQ